MKEELRVKGMTCKSCGMLIKESLGEQEGVNDVKVSHEKGKVIVDYDDSQIDIQKISALIEEEGYEVQ